MNTTTLTTALIRLSKQRLGVKEAATLFLIAEPMSSSKIAAALGIDKGHVLARIQVLRGKKLARNTWTPDGTVLYTLTPEGKKLVNQVLQP